MVRMQTLALPCRPHVQGVLVKGRLLQQLSTFLEGSLLYCPNGTQGRDYVSGNFPCWQNMFCGSSECYQALVSREDTPDNFHSLALKYGTHYSMEMSRSFNYIIAYSLQTD